MSQPDKKQKSNRTEGINNLMVAVIGAGVAGMTAAHELASRGFTVQVFEASSDVMAIPRRKLNEDARLSQQPLVGGLAATQWYRIPRRWGDPLVGRQERFSPLAVEDSRLTEFEDWLPGTQPLSDKPTPVAALWKWEGRWPLIPSEPGGAGLSQWAKDRVKKIADRIIDIAARTGHEYVEVGGVSKQSLDGARERAREVAKVLIQQLDSQSQRVIEIGKKYTIDLENATVELLVVGLGDIHSPDPNRPDSAREYVEIRLRESLLPGEHGYRFFPSFYRHIFDTMRRIPLLTRAPSDPFKQAFLRGRVDDTTPILEHEVATSRTVFDNLNSVDLHAFDSGSRAQVRPMTRLRTRSGRALLGLLDEFQEHSNVPLRDVIQGQLRMLRYATSCRTRRDSYENVTWVEFAHSREGSPEYQRLLEHWPQALVGLQASRADARTTGTVLLQLLLDQVRPSDFRDGTLNAPTSEAWLDPWKRYLEREQRVRFSRLKVSTIKRSGEDSSRYAISGTSRSGDVKVGSAFDYVVIATPLPVTAKLDVPGLSDGKENPLKRAKETVEKSEDYRRVEGSAGPFEHFSGIQFFLGTDFARLRGHVYYTNSPWRLSSVSQSQFRLDRPGVLEGYSGVLSVVVGAFDVEGYNGKTAWKCSSDEFAREVWAQIMRSLRASGSPVPPFPRYHVIDRALKFDNEGIKSNETPFLVNAVDFDSAFSELPGEYQVHDEGIVFAGTYLRTFTRLVTMESANESARHAVNAIIRHGREQKGKDTGQECEVFDPEEHEIDELAPFKEIDAGLIERGLPHWMDILRVEERVQEAFDSGERSLERALLKAFESTGALGRELLKRGRGLLFTM